MKGEWKREDRGGREGRRRKGRRVKEDVLINAVPTHTAGTDTYWNHDLMYMYMCMTCTSDMYA